MVKAERKFPWRMFFSTVVTLHARVHLCSPCLAWGCHQQGWQHLQPCSRLVLQAHMSSTTSPQQPQPWQITRRHVWRVQRERQGVGGKWAFSCSVRCRAGYRSCWSHAVRCLCHQHPGGRAAWLWAVTGSASSVRQRSLYPCSVICFAWSQL